MTGPDRAQLPSTDPDPLASDRSGANRRPWVRVLVRVVVLQAIMLLVLWLLQVRYG